MKVICDSCQASYKIPDEKLIKPINKATCKKCGHRMFIPRPNSSSSEEQTQVTSSKPIAGFAHDGLPIALPPLSEESETTLPGERVPTPVPADEVVLYPATPPPVSRVATSTFHAPKPESAYLERPNEISAEPEPLPSPRTRTLSPSERATTPTPKAYQEPQNHDPRSDQTLMGIGSIFSLAGVLLLVLAFATLGMPLPMMTLVVLGAGTFLAFAGGQAVLFLILTGKRGHRPARTILSILLSLSLSLTAAAAVVAALLFLTPRSSKPVENLVASLPPLDNTLLSEAPAIVPSEPLPDIFPSEVIAEEPIIAPIVTPSSVAQAEVKPLPAARPVESPRPTEPLSVIASNPPKSTETPLGFVELPTTPPPAPTESSTAAVTPVPDAISDATIDTILRSNLGVKKCFFNHKKQTGTLPSLVAIQFTLTPSGVIRDSHVTSSDLVGTDLDRCLTAATSAIAMPPSSGSSRTIKYPFKL